MNNIRSLQEVRNKSIIRGILVDDLAPMGPIPSVDELCDSVPSGQEQDLSDDRCDSAPTGQEPGLTDDRVVCSPGWQQCNGTASENQLSIPLKMSELFDFRLRQCFRDPHGNK